MSRKKQPVKPVLMGQVKRVQRDGEGLVITIRPTMDAPEYIRLGDYLSLEVIGRAIIASGHDPETGKEYWDLSNPVQPHGLKWTTDPPGEMVK